MFISQNQQILNHSILAKNLHVVSTRYATMENVVAFPITMEIHILNVDQNVQVTMNVQNKWHALITNA